jgi:CheY-like chemotaxis protein
MSHTVLVVEDDVDIRQALIEILEEHGFAALGARDGAEALDLLVRATELPCLILLDLMMPVMDGVSFRTAQRNDPRLSSIPVVVLSAYRDVERHAGALDAVSVLRKPPSVRELVSVLQTHC